MQDQDRQVGMRKQRPTRFENPQIIEMVDTFYAKVQQHPKLGPIFNNTIGDNWDVHLQKMYRFWSSVLNTSGVYNGNPMAVHMNLKEKVEPSNFADWLILFKETLGELFTPEEAAYIYTKAENIAQSLSMGMFYNPASPNRLNADS